MPEPIEVVAMSGHECRLLNLLRDEPELVENLRRCTAAQPHQRSMLERLRIHLIRAVGAQKTVARETHNRAD